MEVTVTRHPDDPEAARASKARAVWWLGLAALLTGPLVGGVIPAVMALQLGRQFQRDAYPAGGFLTGAGLVRRGERLAWIGIVLAATAIVAAVAVGVFQAAGAPPDADFPADVD